MPIITIEGPPMADSAVRRTLVQELTKAAAKAYALPAEKMTSGRILRSKTAMPFPRIAYN